jgi:hypothetical protein
MKHDRESPEPEKSSLRFKFPIPFRNTLLGYLNRGGRERPGGCMEKAVIIEGGVCKLKAKIGRVGEMDIIFNGG